MQSITVASNKVLFCIDYLPIFFNQISLHVHNGDEPPEKLLCSLRGGTAVSEKFIHHRNIDCCQLPYYRCLSQHLSVLIYVPCFVCFWRECPHPAGQGLIILEISRSHSRQDSSGRVIFPSQRPLPDNTTQHSQETHIHAPGGIRTHNPSKRSAADTRLGPRGYVDQRGEKNLLNVNCVISCTTSD